MKSEKSEVDYEVVRLRRELEQHLLQAEEKQREFLGMREQGPQAIKDQMCADVMAENERLKAELHSGNRNPHKWQRYQLNAQFKPCIL